MESERCTQFGAGSINRLSNRGRIGLTIKLDDFFVTFNDHCGHTYLNEIIPHNIGIHIIF